MTDSTAWVGLVVLMTAHAAIHGGDVHQPRHHIEPAHIAVTQLATQSSLQMASVAPRDCGRDNVDANPGDGLFVLVEAGELLNCGFVLRDAGMTGHACAGFGDPHVLSGIAIDVAISAFQPKFQMGFVAIWDWLFRSWRRVLNFIGRLLSRNKRRGQSPQQQQTSR